MTNSRIHRVMKVTSPFGLAATRGRGDTVPNTEQRAPSRLRLAINGRFLAQPTTGVQRVCTEITRAIDTIVAEGAVDMDVRLICHPKVSVDHLELRSIRLHRTGHVSGHAWEQTALPLAASDDVLLCLGNTAPIYSLLTRKPVAVMIHDLSYRQFPSAYRFSYRLGHRMLTPLLLRNADPLFTVSESERANLIAMGLNRAVIATQNGAWCDIKEAEAEAPAPVRGMSGQRRYALYVGSMSQRKNLAGVMATAVRLAREDGIDFRFVGSAGSIFAQDPLSVPSDLKDAIIFLGQVDDRHALASLYRGASCLVFPSFYEASPMPPLEAMHFGCPVVASDIPSMRERCGDAAEYCDPTSVDSILAATRRVLTDPQLAATLSERGHARTRLYSWSSQALKVLTAIQATAVRRGRLAS